MKFSQSCNIVFQQYHVRKFEFSFYLKGLAFFPEVHVVPFISQPYIVNFLFYLKVLACFLKVQVVLFISNPYLHMEL